MKIGDEVVITEYNGHNQTTYSLTTITEITPRKIKTENGDFVNNGRYQEWGADDTGYGRYYRKLSPNESWEKAQKQNEIVRIEREKLHLRIKISNANLTNLTLDELKQIIGIIETVNEKGKQHE